MRLALSLGPDEGCAEHSKYGTSDFIVLGGTRSDGNKLAFVFYDFGGITNVVSKVFRLNNRPPENLRRDSLVVLFQLIALNWSTDDSYKNKNDVISISEVLHSR